MSFLEFHAREAAVHRQVAAGDETARLAGAEEDRGAHELGGLEGVLQDGADEVGDGDPQVPGEGLELVLENGRDPRVKDALFADFFASGLWGFLVGFLVSSNY